MDVDSDRDVGVVEAGSHAGLFMSSQNTSFIKIFILFAWICFPAVLIIKAQQCL